MMMLLLLILYRQGRARLYSSVRTHGECGQGNVHTGYPGHGHVLVQNEKRRQLSDDLDVLAV